MSALTDSHNAQGEAVGEVFGPKAVSTMVALDKPLPPGTKLYTAPPAAQPKPADSGRVGDVSSRLRGLIAEIEQPHQRTSDPYIKLIAGELRAIAALAAQGKGDGGPVAEVKRLAALAQNAQGEAVTDGPSDSDVERACHRYYNAGFAVALPRPEAMRAALTTYHKRLHAERARVPDQVVALISKWREPAAGTEGRESDPYMAGYNDACDHLASELESSILYRPPTP